MNKDETLKLMDLAIDAIVTGRRNNTLTRKAMEDSIAFYDLLRYDIEEGKISYYEWDKLSTQEKLLYAIARMYKS